MIGDVNYSLTDLANVFNFLTPGEGWRTIVLVSKSSGGWEAADAEPGNWRIKIHPERRGGTAHVERVASAVADADDAKRVTFDVPAASTALFSAHPTRVAVDMQRQRGGAWTTLSGSEGYAMIRESPGAAR